MSSPAGWPKPNFFAHACIFVQWPLPLAALEVAVADVVEVGVAGLQSAVDSVIGMFVYGFQFLKRCSSSPYSAYGVHWMYS